MALQDALAQRAREAADVYLPGYTHLQRAQPVLLAHHLLAHGWALARDVDRLLTTVDRLNIVAARRGRAGRLVAAARPRLRRGRARVPRPLRELARRRVRPRLRGRGALRPRPARRAPVAHGRGDRAVVDRGVRLLHARRRLRHRQLDAAAEEEPRRGRAGPGQVGPPHRPPRPRCWSPSRASRWPTTATSRRTRSRSSTRWPRCTRALIALRGVYETATWNEERMQAAADGPAASAIDLAEMLVEQGMPFRQAHALSAAWCASRSSATCRWSSWWRPTPTWARPPWSCSSPVWR